MLESWKPRFPERSHGEWAPFTITPGSRTFYQYGVKVASAESELLPLKVVLRFRCFPTTFTGKKFANRVKREWNWPDL